MEIRIRETGAVMQESEFRAYQKSVGGPSWDRSTAELLDVLGADVVFAAPTPAVTKYQIAYRDGAELIGDKWYAKYSVADMDAEAQAAADATQAAAVRATRNARLKDSDWSQGKDISDAISTVWATYRQALRDVPAQSGFPWEVTWPSQPE